MKLRYALVIGLALVFASGSCNCSDQAVEREGDGWTVEVGFDGSAPGDTSADSRDLRPDASDSSWFPDVPSCRRGNLTFSLDVVRFDVPYLSPAAPAVSRGWVYSEARARENLDASLGVVRISPKTGEVERHLSSSEHGDRLLEVGEANALAWRRGGSDGTPKPVIVTPEGEETVLEGFSDRWNPRGYRFLGGEGHPFDGRRFAAVLQNDPNSSPGWVGYYDGSESREIHIEEWARAPVALTPEGFIVSARTGPLSGGGNYEMYRWNPEAGVERVTETERHERDPVSNSSRDVLYWSHDAAIFRTRSESFVPQTIHEGYCGSVDAWEGRTAVFTCNDDSGQSGFGRIVFGDELYFTDGERKTKIPTDGIVYKPRVWGETVVWAEYPERDAFVPGGEGELRLWNVEFDAARTIAPVGAPCFGCDSLHPDLHLSIGLFGRGDRIVAWNYANPDAETPRREQNFGAVARVAWDCTGVRDSF